jgi:hypothetical protein
MASIEERINLVTCHNDVVNIIRRTPLCQVTVDSTDIIDVQEAAFRFAEEARVVLDCITFCWRVYDGKHFFEMVLNQLIGVRRGNGGRSAATRDAHVLITAVLFVCREAERIEGGGLQ